MERQYRILNEFLTKRISRPVKKTWTMLNERYLNIHTIRTVSLSSVTWQGSETEKAKHDDNKGYGTADYYWIRKCRSILNPGQTDIVYDLGSGMGRVLCTFAQKKLKKCVGIELSEDLCDISRRNAERLAQKKTPIEIRCEDVTQSDISDGTIYFLFNPFGTDTLKDVLMNLEHSLCDNNRHMKIVYYNPVHVKELEECKWLRKYHEIRTFHGYAISFWENIETVKGVLDDVNGRTSRDLELLVS